MTKDVLVAIKGMQFTVGADGDGNVQIVTPGEYYKRDNNHYVIYEETTEGTDETTRNVIKFKDNFMELTKRGFVNVHMMFEENKKNLTNYVTPFGSLLIGIDAKKITLTDREDSIKLNIDYALEINYEFLADCKISMELTQRGAD